MKTIYRQSALTQRIELKGESSAVVAPSAAMPIKEYAPTVAPTVDASLDPDASVFIANVAGGSTNPNVTLDTPIVEVFGTLSVTPLTSDTNNTTFVQPTVLQTAPFVKGVLIDVVQALLQSQPVISEAASFFETAAGMHPILNIPQNNFTNPIISALQTSIRNAFNTQYRLQLQTLASGGSTTSRLFDELLARESDLVLQVAGKKGIAHPTAEDVSENSPYPIILLDPINYEISNPVSLHEYAQTISGNTLLDKTAIVRLSNADHFEKMVNDTDASLILDQLPSGFMLNYIQDTGYVLQRSLDVLTTVKKFNALDATQREIKSRVDGGAWDRIIGQEEIVYQKMRLTNFKLEQAKKKTEYASTFFDNSLKDFTAFIDTTLAINSTLMEVSRANRDETALILGTSGYESQNYINVEYLFPRSDFDPAF